MFPICLALEALKEKEQGNISRPETEQRVCLWDAGVERGGEERLYNAIPRRMSQLQPTAGGARPCDILDMDFKKKKKTPAMSYYFC